MSKKKIVSVSEVFATFAPLKKLSALFRDSTISRDAATITGHHFDIRYGDGTKKTVFKKGKDTVLTNHKAQKHINRIRAQIVKEGGEGQNKGK
jgi:hypothetical protein